jgi:hypothetical protein
MIQDLFAWLDKVDDPALLETWTPGAVHKPHAGESDANLLWADLMAPPDAPPGE